MNIQDQLHLFFTDFPREPDSALARGREIGLGNATVCEVAAWCWELDEQVRALATRQGLNVALMGGTAVQLRLQISEQRGSRDDDYLTDATPTQIQSLMAALAQRFEALAPPYFRPEIKTPRSPTPGLALITYEVAVPALLGHTRHRPSMNMNPSNSKVTVYENARDELRAERDALEAQVKTLDSGIEGLEYLIAREVEAELNNRPRMCLNDRTPNQLVQRWARRQRIRFDRLKPKQVPTVDKSTRSEGWEGATKGAAAAGFAPLPQVQLLAGALAVETGSTRPGRWPKDHGAEGSKPDAARLQTLSVWSPGRILGSPRGRPLLRSEAISPRIDRHPLLDGEHCPGEGLASSGSQRGITTPHHS